MQTSSYLIEMTTCNLLNLLQEALFFFAFSTTPSLCPKLWTSLNTHKKSCILCSLATKSWSMSQGIMALHVFLLLPCPWLIFSSQETSILLKGPGGEICNFARKFLRVTSLTLNLYCEQISCPCGQLYVHELADWKLAPLHPLDSPMPRLLENETLLWRRHVSLPSPQRRPPWQETRTSSTRVIALSNPKLATWRLG